MRMINYESPQIEVVEIEIESSILIGSDIDDIPSSLEDFIQGNW